jgi:hypothetical protein
MERCVGKAFHMSHSAITRSSLPTIGAYIPAVFLGAYLQSSSQIPFVQAILFSLPIITLGIARSRTNTAPHLVSVPQPDIDMAEHTPVFSFISRAS